MQQSAPAGLTAADLNFNPPQFPQQTLTDALLHHYGISGSLHALDGERDQNHRVACADGREFVFKVSSPGEASGAVDFQIGANDYLYGTRFFSYLALTYGPEKVMQWLRHYINEVPHGPTPIEPTRAMMLGQYVVAIYGGYFGGGIGFLMLAALSVLALVAAWRMGRSHRSA